MNQFKFLQINHFEHQLKTYESMTASLQKNIAHLEPKKNINELTTEEAHTLEFYKQSLEILIESTFLQMYAKLEEGLYQECATQFIKKNASISRFESALSEQGYTIDGEYWSSLLNMSKIRNCLLHGNGRLDSDRYGMDTKETIKFINSDANAF